MLSIRYFTYVVFVTHHTLIISDQLSTGMKFYVQHEKSRFYWNVGTNGDLVLSQNLSTMFEYNNLSKIMVGETGKCVKSTGGPIELSDSCSDEKSNWILFQNPSNQILVFMNPSTNRCVHPKNGGVNVKEGNQNVLAAACDPARIALNVLSK